MARNANIRHGAGTDWAGGTSVHETLISIRYYTPHIFLRVALDGRGGSRFVDNIFSEESDWLHYRLLLESLGKTRSNEYVCFRCALPSPIDICRLDRLRRIVLSTFGKLRAHNNVRRIPSVTLVGRSGWQGGGGVGVGHATPSRRIHIHRRNLADQDFAAMVSAAHDALMEYGFTQMGSVKPASCFSPVVHCSRRHANITSALFSHSAALCLPLHPAPQSNRNGAMWHRRA